MIYMLTNEWSKTRQQHKPYLLKNCQALYLATLCPVHGINHHRPQSLLLKANIM